MPFVRFVGITAEFESAEAAEKVLSTVIQQFRGTESGGLPAVPDAKAVTAAPPASVTAPTSALPPASLPTPSDIPSARRSQKRTGRVTAVRKSPAAGGSRESAPRQAPGGGLSVSAAIRQVLPGAGALAIEAILKRVTPLIAPRTTSSMTVSTVCAQLTRQGKIRRVNEGVYAAL